MHRKENKGFSTIELIVVIAIMAVLVAAGATFTGLIPASRMKECVKETTSMIEKTRTNAMSYGGAELSIYRDEDGIVAKMTVSKTINGADKPTTEEKTVGVSAIAVYYRLGDNGEWTELTAAEADKGLIITFDRASGAFGTTTVNGTVQTEKCTGIRFTYGSRTSTLKLITLTGKVTTE